MATSIYINTDLKDITANAVANINRPTQVVRLQQIIEGEITDVDLHLVKSNGQYDARSGTDVAVAVSVSAKGKSATSGTFTLSASTQSTGALAWNASAEAVKDALNALNDGTGAFGSKVDVKKLANGSYRVIFDQPGERIVMAGKSIDLAPESEVTAATSVVGSPSIRAQQIIQISQQPAIYSEDWTIDGNSWTGQLDANTARVQGLIADGADAFFEVKIGVDVICQIPISVFAAVAAPNSLPAHILPSNLDEFANDPSTNGNFSPSNWLTDLFSPHLKAVWGNITGTLSDQTDLQDALDAKGSASQQTTNTDNIAANTSNITANTSNITANTSNITTNTSNIATNTSDIATNTSSIATNTSNIATNTSNIGQKLEKGNNLSDLTNASTARQNLGLGGSDDVFFGSLSINADDLQLIDNTIGSLSTVHIELVEDGGGGSNLKSGETTALNWTAAGVKLTSGSRVNEIETTLTNDDAHIPTSGAVIDYVDRHSHIETTPVTVITGTLGETHSRYKSDGWTKAQIEAITFAIEAVKLGSEVPSIGSRWLINNTDLKMVDVGNIATIPFNSFKNCSALEQVIIRNSTNVGQFAFMGCTSLTNLDLGRVENISDNAFDGCTALETVTIPDSLVDDNSFGDSTFEGCTALVNINCYATYDAFGQNPTGDRLLNTSSSLIIHAKPNTGWTAGTDLTIQGNASVDVILDLV